MSASQLTSDRRSFMKAAAVTMTTALGISAIPDIVAAGMTTAPTAAKPDRPQVWANGREVPVEECRVSAVPFNRRWPGHQRSLDQTEIAYFASLQTGAPVEVRIAPNRPFQNVTVHPLAKGITPRIEGNLIVITVKETGGYTVELDGMHHALHLFVDPIQDYDVNLKDSNTLYFGPGVHDAGMIELKSGQTLYIDAGAIVYASIRATNVDHIRILGRGILDNSKNVEQILFQVPQAGNGTRDVGNSLRQNTIRLESVKHALIDGIIIRDSLVYNVAAFACENLEVNNVKIIGCWRYNTDGIDLHNCSHCVIRNCFLRTYDDSICVKGWTQYPQECRDILVDNCTIWCDWGRALEIGAETAALRIHDITFRNCYIIRTTQVALDIQNVDYAEIYDVHYENIDVEYDPVSQRPQMQSTDAEVYRNDPRSDFMPDLMIAQIYKHYEYSVGERRGENHDITYRDIRVLAPRMPRSSFSGFDSQHMTRNVSISDLYLNGKRLTSLGEAQINVGEFADGVTLQPR